MDSITTTINPVTALVQRLEDREEHLSFSSFKAFCDSPRDFIAYKMREKVTTPAMAFGSAVHCLILESDEFESRYLVADKPDLRTKAGKIEWAAINEQAQAQGLEIITQADHDQAKRMRDFAYQDEGIRWVLDQIHTTEKKITWKYGGWDWRGQVDGVGNDLYLDLKIINPLDRKKIRWRIQGDRLIWQGALYHQSDECRGKDFYIIALDNAINGMAIHFEKKALLGYMDEIDWHISQFNKCVFQDAWNDGYSFWAGRSRIFNWLDL